MSEQPDVYDEILRLIATEAVRMKAAGETPPELGLGAVAGAVMSTTLFAWADQYGPNWEPCMDSVIQSAKDTLRAKRPAEAAQVN